MIFPSKRNTEAEYLPYMEYAQKCYDNFTGNYSKKTREAREARRQKEAE